jgi:YbbR-like protein
MAFAVTQRLRSAITENLNLKLLSLAFAIVLYVLFHGQDATRTVSINVDALVPPERANRILLTQLPPLHVTLRGPQGMLDDLRPDDLTVQVDLKSGTQTQVTYTPALLRLQPGLKVEQISPSEALPLEWDDVIVRDVPVHVSVVGSCAPGFVVKGTPVSDPLNVRVRGPRSEVIVLQYARAEPIDVSGLTAGKYTRPLGFEIEASARVKPEVKSVDVTVEVTQEMVERTFTKVPVAVVGSPKAKTQPAEVDVRLTCPPDIAHPLRPEQIVPRVQVSSAAEHGSEALPVQFSFDPCSVVVMPSLVVVKW